MEETHVIGITSWRDPSIDVVVSLILISYYLKWSAIIASSKEYQWLAGIIIA